jgi:hypothetical protein
MGKADGANPFVFRKTLTTKKIRLISAAHLKRTDRRTLPDRPAGC